MNTITTKEAAKTLGVKPVTVLNKVKTGQLHPVNKPSPGIITKFDEEEVRKLAEQKPKKKRKKTTARNKQELKKKSSAVKHPDHYQNGLGVEVIDIINEYFRDSYNLGNVLKYLLRADKKGNRQQDLEKALQYLTWEVEHGRGT